MLKVQSSWVHAIAYVRGNVQVKTKEDRNYIYLDVPRKVFVKMMNSASVGKFMNRHILDKYECVALFPTDG
jgi:hypothetical protein